MNEHYVTNNVRVAGLAVTINLSDRIFKENILPWKTIVVNANKKFFHIHYKYQSKIWNLRFEIYSKKN